MNFNLKIVKEAAARWRSQQEKTEEYQSRIEAGRIDKVESPERINARLERLNANAIRDQARVVEVATAAADIKSSGLAGPPTQLIERIGLERIIGKKDFLNVSFLELALAVSRFVGRMNIKMSPTTTVGFGTGFMVSPRLLLTNNHVIASKQDALHSEVEFDFQYDRFGRLLPVVSYGLEPNTFFLTDVDLDFTLIAVADRSVGSGQVELKGYGWNRLIEEEGKALIGDALNVVQHPNGEAKQISLRSNQLLNLLPDFAHYETDTEPGSSGSPVYNDQWEVVALHHSGVPATDAQGNLLDINGNIWQDGDDPERLKWIANEGVRISRIVKDIKSRQLSSSESNLRREMLESEPPHPVVAAMRAEEEARRKDNPQVAVPGIPAGGAVSFTVPLTISVHLGGTPIPALAAPPAVAAPPAGAHIRGGGAPDLRPQNTTSISDLPAYREAIAELERSAQRPYYEPAKDKGSRDEYYATLGDISQLSNTDLYHALQDLLTNTHTNKINYKPAVHVYPWIDLHKVGSKLRIRSIYSGKEFDARDLIEEDFRIERQREQLRESLMRESSFSVVEIRRQWDLLEATLPFNCEHVVPQSWFAKKEPMRGDLHHLFACEVGCNSFRSNIPYYDFPDFEEAVRDSCGKREENKFEPTAGKGAVARATLYFILRYPGQINQTASEYKAERIATLLNWHTSVDVSEYELHRNAAIFEKQGNRNPLIDFPEWAGHIDFAAGLG